VKIIERRTIMAERDEFGAFLLGFIVGGLTGAVASLLLAPQSGQSTRMMLKEKAIVLGEQVNVTYDEAKVRAEEITAEARTRAEAITAEARVRADEAVKQARANVEDLQKRGQVILDEQRVKINEAMAAKAPNGAGGEETPAEG
jgi:gas vesicle protein